RPVQARGMRGWGDREMFSLGENGRRRAARLWRGDSLAALAMLPFVIHPLIPNIPTSPLLTQPPAERTCETPDCMFVETPNLAREVGITESVTDVPLYVWAPPGTRE